MQTVAIRVRPRSGRDEVVGERNGRLLVNVKAAPERGKANESACRLIARYFGVPKGAVTVKRGMSSRDKLVEIRGAADVRPKSHPG